MLCVCVCVCDIIKKMSAENIEPLTFVSLKLCFLSFVYCPNECLYSYL